MTQIVAQNRAAASAEAQSTAIQRSRIQPTGLTSEDPLAGLLHIPTSVSVEVPIVALTVRDLFRLEKGSILSTSQPTGANVPLRVGGRLIAWGEFQVVDDQLSLRIAELA
jgi:flagellar motor switch/type III secretory pathway protein FliN